MTSNLLVSVVIPAYNAADYLPEVIQAVIDQSYKHWELLVIDDGSKDNTAEVVNDFCQKDSRVRLISKENGGVSVARNLGAQLAKGDLVAFLDSDDLWLKDKLLVHVNHMAKNPKVGVSFSRVELIESDGQTTNKLTDNIAQEVNPQDLFYSNPTVTTSNLVIRKSVFQDLNGFDESMQYNEDIDLLFRLAIQNDWKLEGIDQVLVQYRLHASGLSSTLKKMEDGWVKLMQKARQVAPNLVEQHYSAAQSAQLQYLARQTLRLDLPALLGVSFVNRALISNWPNLYKNPKLVALAILIYFKFATFNMFKLNI
ncbi:glycosyltransferase family 2 protein [Leptothoe kymatousa]|uniref:Glycosyltransferase family 2 protein n=1 Tax=Leptothoe kymatousa TAU-MAC 1615 TaxID=2364775 RepID=A0ABS5Y0U9_9CYAN|nr:glycosyltransferase family 2 protein [Leptothoe kymatousa]MBT9311113.1 glycosyltransferase family 2 protein [Leptothoe kymatousa TAU-MAC 1615]